MFYCLQGPDRSAGQRDKDLLHSTTNKWPDRTGWGFTQGSRHKHSKPSWMKEGNLDIPPPLAQLGFNAYESTGLSWQEGKGQKYTAITLVQGKRKRQREWKPRWSVSSQRLLGCLKVGHGGRVASETRQGALVERAGIFSDTDPQTA